MSSNKVSSSTPTPSNGLEIGGTCVGFDSGLRGGYVSRQRGHLIGGASASGFRSSGASVSGSRSSGASASGSRSSSASVGVRNGSDLVDIGSTSSKTRGLGLDVSSFKRSGSRDVLSNTASCSGSNQGPRPTKKL